MTALRARAERKRAEDALQHAREELAIIDNHRGRLWATANAGHGATFQFALPVMSNPPTVG